MWTANSEEGRAAPREDPVFAKSPRRHLVAASMEGGRGSRPRFYAGWRPLLGARGGVADSPLHPAAAATVSAFHQHLHQQSSSTTTTAAAAAAVSEVQRPADWKVVA